MLAPHCELDGSLRCGFATQVVVIRRRTSAKQPSTIDFMCDTHGTPQEYERIYDPAHYSFERRRFDKQ